MTQTKTPTVILISGRGSNMMSLVDAARAEDYPAKIVSVISNRPDAAGIAWAKAQGIATLVIDHKCFKSREAFEAELDKAKASWPALEAAAVEFAKKQAEARAKAAAEKAKAAPKK